MVAAGFSLLGLFNIWLQTSYLPSKQRPMVDMTTSLTREESTTTNTVLKADITLHNRGLANAVIVGSLYRITYDADYGLPATGPADGASLFNGAPFDLAGSPAAATTYQETQLAAAFNFTGANHDDFTGGNVRLLRADEIAPMREFLLPGQTWSTEAVVSVPTAYAATLRLTAQVALITDRYLGDTKACGNGTANQWSSGFLAQARQIHTKTTASRRVDSLCVETALSPQSAVQALVGDRPSIRSYYVLADGTPADFHEVLSGDADRDFGIGDTPYLVTTYQNGSGNKTYGEGIRAAQAIDAQDPSAVIESRAEYGVPRPPPTTTGPGSG